MSVKYLQVQGNCSQDNLYVVQQLCCCDVRMCFNPTAERLSHTIILRKMIELSIFVLFVSIMNIKPNQEGACFDVVVVVDPLSKGIPLVYLYEHKFV